MPPKEAPAAPKKLPPMELCGCGENTYRPPPRGKKPPAPIIHRLDCRFQRSICSDYPHLPPCEVCQYPCKFCLGRYRWCPHCYETQCKFRFQRVVIGIDVPPVIPPPPPPPGKTTPGKAPPPGQKGKKAPPPELPPVEFPAYHPTGLRPAQLVYNLAAEGEKGGKKGGKKGAKKK